MQFTSKNTPKSGPVGVTVELPVARTSARDAPAEYRATNPFVAAISGGDGLLELTRRRATGFGRASPLPPDVGARNGLFGFDHCLELWFPMTRVRLLRRTTRCHVVCFACQSASPVKTRPGSRGTRFAVAEAAENRVLLSWGSSKFAPPPIWAARVHSQTTRKSPFGWLLPHSQRVPSLSFLPTSTASSTSTSRVCCAPLPVMGFAAFRSPRLAAQSPPRYATPFEAFPFTTAAPCRHGRCLLAVGARLRRRHVATTAVIPTPRPQGIAPL
jgi:hypothetical protein